MAWFFQKKSLPSPPAARQPHGDWPWRLTLGAGPSTADFEWADIVHGLDTLVRDQDSFLILEQKDPSQPGQYWFLQSAIALAGSHAGQYIVGCGYASPGGPVLLEQYYDTPRDIIPLFAAAWQGHTLDLSGFEDHSPGAR